MGSNCAAIDFHSSICAVQLDLCITARFSAASNIFYYYFSNKKYENVRAHKIICMSSYVLNKCKCVEQ